MSKNGLGKSLMTLTRKYFEDILDSFDRLCESYENGVLEYYETKNKLSALLKKIGQYHILNLNLSADIYEVLEDKKEKNITSERPRLLLEIYSSLINLNIEKELFSIDEPNYLKSLEQSLVKLQYDGYLKIYDQIKKILTDPYLLKIHGKNFPTYLDIKDQASYDLYKTELNNDKSPIRFKGKLKKIAKNDLAKIEFYFENKIREYKSYIFEHYPSIKDEFSYYSNWIRVYFVYAKDKRANMRIFVYKEPIDSRSLYIHPYYLDFIPYEAENIEETEQKIIGGLFTYVRLDEDFESRDRLFFSKSNIHSELISIYIRNSDKEAREEFFKFLFKCKGYSFIFFNTPDKKGFDFVAKKDKKIQYFQFLNNELKNIDVLQEKLRNSEVKENVMFISTYQISHDIAKSIESAGISFRSLHALAYEHLNNDNSIILHWYIKSKLGELAIQESSLQNQADVLIYKLGQCKTGIKGWAEYENICTEILKYLFEDNFRKYNVKNQSYTKDGIFRRDLIINNNYRNSSSFWADVKNDFNANLIVVDFKNYEQPLTQNEVYLPTKYLNMITGNVAIVISRKGLDESATKLQKRLLSVDSKLIISLNDNDLIDMLRDKSIGEEITYVLDNKKFLIYENE